jgi:small-conductance mechanosensitive channel
VGHLALGLFDLVRKSQAIADVASQTDALKVEITRLREPIRQGIRGILARGREITDQELGGALPPAAQNAGELDGMMQHFQELTAINVPLAKQERMLETVRANLHDWRGSVGRHEIVAARALLVRLAGIVAAIAVVLLAAWLWRTATFRFVHDVRRRRQLLLVRRIVVWVASVFIVLSAFLTDLGSWATIAGFATAGIAVALQSVILSLVAYFFLIGRYGVRAGDRVTIAGVTGDVVEVGLVRLYVAELSGAWGDLHPTGRVVLFPNSVIFQASANFYKQLPGTEYSWHEAALSLAPDCDLKLTEQRLLAAADSVLQDYRDVLLAQHAKATTAMNMEVEEPRAKGRLRLGSSGLEFVLRYPVEIRQSAEIDDRITRALVEAIERAPGLKFVDAGNSRIQVEALARAS